MAVKQNPNAIQAPDGGQYVVLTDGAGNLSPAGGATGVAQGSTTSGQTGDLSQGAVTTASPTYTTGQTSPFSLTTKGGVRAAIIDSAGAELDYTLPAPVAGPAAHDAAISGAPVRTGSRAVTANPTAVADGDTVDNVSTLVGAQIVKFFSIPEAEWSYVAPSGGKIATGGVTIKTAGAAGLRNYLTGLQISNSGAAGTEVQIKDGAAGTIIWRGYVAAAFGTVDVRFTNPLKSTAATLLELDLSSGTTVAVYVNAQGYVAP